MMKNRIKAFLLTVCVILAAFAVSCGETANESSESFSGSSYSESSERSESTDSSSSVIDDESKWTDWGD